MEGIIDIKEGRNQLKLRLISPDDDADYEWMIGELCSRIAGRRFTAEQFVEVLVEEFKKLVRRKGHTEINHQGGLVSRLDEIIDDLVLDPNHSVESLREAKILKDNLHVVISKESFTEDKIE